MGWTEFLLAVLMIGICALLMVVVLLQRGRGGGLAGAFGGGGGGSSAFGAKTGDVLTWITVAVAAVFLLLAVVNNFAFDKSPETVTPATSTAESQPDPGTESGTTTVLPPITTEETQPGDASTTGGAEGAAPVTTQPAGQPGAAGDPSQGEPTESGSSPSPPAEDPPTP